MTFASDSPGGMPFDDSNRTHGSSSPRLVSTNPSLKCEATHLIYCFSGRMKVVHDDGSEGEIGPGDVMAIEPGHDAWVVGDEPCLSIDFGGYRQYAKPSE
jgi:hypothetical protein